MHCLKTYEPISITRIELIVLCTISEQPNLDSERQVYKQQESNG
jgi:hypothetical protein